jgi:uncharacterized protein (DUF697 family)
MVTEEKKQQQPKEALNPNGETEQEAPPLEHEEALKVVKNRMLWAAGIGLVPVPLIDFVALTGLQMEMLRKLARIYEVPFKEQIGKSVVASLLGSVVPAGMSPGVASLIKLVPVIGHATGALTMSVIGGATTWAVGKVFIQHFASGGTFLDFDPEKVKAHFKAFYDEEVARKTGGASSSR